MRMTLESDRGCVLITAARLEEVVTEILDWTLQQNGASKTLRNEMFGANGPLATFSSKLRIAFGFGLIRAELYRDVDRIRKLRNDAAHTSRHFDLDNVDVVHLMENMHIKYTDGDFEEYFRSLPTFDHIPDPLLRNSIAIASGVVKPQKLRFVTLGACIEAQLLVALHLIGGLEPQNKK